MPFDWEDNLRLARVLQTATLADVPVEALRRCIVGRSYSAAYGHAFQHVTTYLGFRGKQNADDHGALRSHLRQRRRVQVADYLDDLRDWRNDCDYDADVSHLDLPIIVTDALNKAQYVIDALPPPTP